MLAARQEITDPRPDRPARDLQEKTNVRTPQKIDRVHEQAVVWWVDMLSLLCSITRRLLPSRPTERHGGGGCEVELSPAPYPPLSRHLRRAEGRVQPRLRSRKPGSHQSTGRAGAGSVGDVADGEDALGAQAHEQLAVDRVTPPELLS